MNSMVIGERSWPTEGDKALPPKTSEREPNRPDDKQDGKY